MPTRRIKLEFPGLGLGSSDGDFADLVHAADYLRKHYRAQALLIGHSLGGAKVILLGNTFDGNTSHEGYE